MHPVLQWLEQYTTSSYNFDFGSNAITFSTQDIPPVSMEGFDKLIEEGPTSDTAANVLAQIESEGLGEARITKRLWYRGERGFRFSVTHVKDGAELGWTEHATQPNGTGWAAGYRGDFYRVARRAEAAESWDMKRYVAIAEARRAAFGTFPAVDDWSQCDVTETPAGLLKVEGVNSKTNDPFTLFVQQADDGSYFYKAARSRAVNPKRVTRLYFYAVDHRFDETLDRWVVTDAITRLEGYATRWLRFEPTQPQTRQQFEDIVREPPLRGEDPLRGTLSTTQFVVYEPNKTVTFAVAADGSTEVRDTEEAGPSEPAQSRTKPIRYLGWLLIPLAVAAVVFVKVRKS